MEQPEQETSFFPSALSLSPKKQDVLKQKLSNESGGGVWGAEATAALAE